MAYSTRRKSVNLSLLGIHVPRASHRPPSASASAPATSDQQQQHPHQPPPKKVKRSHSDANPSDPFSSPSKPSSQKSPPVKLHKPSVATHTPPPSPPPAGELDHAEFTKVDTEGINDDVVVATVEQLEKTGNRPHLLKELAAAIAGHVAVVESSANQSAIISSRLTNYLKRPWSTLAPCPLGKDLIGTHPKRLYFFLTTRPRQPFPEPETPSNNNRIISPSLTSAADEDEDTGSRRRSEMSPSPELELSSADFNDDDSPMMSRTTSFPNSHLNIEVAPIPGLAQSRTSPPLERDEHEFTQTANTLQLLRRSESAEMKVEITLTSDQADEPMIVVEDESEESAVRRNKEAADVLFGQSDHHLSLRRPNFLASSPMLNAQMDIDSMSGKPVATPLSLSIHDDKMESSFVWSELKSPETLELDELDDLFESY